MTDHRLRRRAADLRVFRDLRRDFRLDRPRVQAELVQDRSDDPAFLPEQREEQVLRRQFRVPGAARKVLRLGDRLLRLDCKLVEIHGLPHIECVPLKSLNELIDSCIPNNTFTTEALRAQREVSLRPLGLCGESAACKNEATTRGSARSRL